MDASGCSGGCACQPTAPDRGSVSRRGILAGSAAAVAVLALGACAPGEEASTSGTTPGDPTTQPPAESESATPADDSSGQGESSGEPLAGTGDFPVGGGVVVKTASGVVVITHPTDTDFLAFNGTCPHQGCPVTEVLENTILCNCHGSVFDGSTGDRLEGPAPIGLKPVPIQVSDGEIYLA